MNFPATLTLLVLLACATAAAPAKACTFTPGCDYGKGSREMAPATTKEECCALCEKHDGCAAGVLAGADCWFKTVAEVAGGCKKASPKVIACNNPSVKPPPGPPPPPSCKSSACQALIVTYAALLKKTCDAVLPKLPTLNAADEAAFMALYKNMTDLKDDAAVVAAATKVLADPKVQAFLTAPDSFGAGGLDATMVQCALITQATPTGLAEFAVEGAAQAALITKLLADTILMRDMLVAGGASSTMGDKGGGCAKGSVCPPRFGKAMELYQKFIAASNYLTEESAAAAAPPTGAPWDDRTQATILKRLALGTALEHAVPIGEKYKDAPCDQAYDWCPTAQSNPNASTFIEPVARYMHYETAYKAGDLDSEMEVLTAWEVRHTTNSPSTDDDLAWLRQSLAIYRPDHIVLADPWRYARAVRTEVAYGDPQCAKMPGVCDGHYAEIPAADGVCGPRAFFGRYTRLAFGMPVWGATQPGHAAMTTWTPAGWKVLLGASWPFCWWGARSGPDFILEATAREIQADYQKVLRGGWAANAKGEAPVSHDWGRDGSKAGFCRGGPWSALMLYQQKITAAKSCPNIGHGNVCPPRVVGKPVVPTKGDALRAKWPTKLPAPTVSTAADGTVTIPAAAFTSKNHSASLTVMKSMDDGEQVLHGGCASTVGPPCLNPLSSSWSYEITAEAAGTYYFTANITTWHYNQDAHVSLNGAKAVDIGAYYTVGWWNETQPLEVALIAGKNTVELTRLSTRELVFKSFTLYKKAPVVPKPPGNYTPTPAPPTPPPGDYIEVPAATSCTKQGITNVPAEDCSRACLALGFKSTGPRARPNITGCFVVTGGQYKGNCNFNTNKSATCVPPCYLEGQIVRNLCIRK